MLSCRSSQPGNFLQSFCHTTSLRGFKNANFCLNPSSQKFYAYLLKVEGLFFIEAGRRTYSIQPKPAPFSIIYHSHLHPWVIYHIHIYKAILRQDVSNKNFSRSLHLKQFQLESKRLYNMIWNDSNFIIMLIILYEDVNMFLA